MVVKQNVVVIIYPKKKPLKFIRRKNIVQVGVIIFINHFGILHNQKVEEVTYKVEKRSEKIETSEKIKTKIEKKLFDTFFEHLRSKVN